MGANMYHFNITKEENGGFRFELDGIKMLVDGFTIVDNTHKFTNPEQVVAFFDVENNLYGISNSSSHYQTAEEFQDAMLGQFRLFAHHA